MMYAMWPDGTICELEELEEYLLYMSDDYELVIGDDEYVSNQNTYI